MLFRPAPWRPRVVRRWLPPVFSVGVVGAITTLPLVNNTGTVLASISGITAFVHNPATGALVVLKSSLSTDAAGVLEFSDALIVAGTSYRVVFRVTGTGAEGMDTYTAA
jgi:hypothetical protein